MSNTGIYQPYYHNNDKDWLNLKYKEYLHTHTDQSFTEIDLDTWTNYTGNQMQNHHKNYQSKAGWEHSTCAVTE
jgi:hypothetical protein